MIRAQPAIQRGFGWAMLVGLALAPIPPAHASRLSLQTGGYTLGAQSAGRFNLLGSIGVVRLAFHLNIAPSWDLTLGYTVATSRIFSGDLAYGLDISASWYFLGKAEAQKIEGPQAEYLAYEVFRPFLSAGFYQRQYQSLQAGFGGFGAGAGIDFGLAQRWTLRPEVRALFLFGPNNSTAINADFLAGISFQL
jgi:hypothetical protein